MQLTIRSNSKKPQEFEGKTFTVALPRGYRDQGTAFDRFGMLNKPKAGNPMTIYFDDLRYDGKVEDFSQDPGWVAVGNDATFADRERVGAGAGSERTGRHDLDRRCEAPGARGRPDERKHGADVTRGCERRETARHQPVLVQRQETRDRNEREQVPAAEVRRAQHQGQQGCRHDDPR